MKMTKKSTSIRDQVKKLNSATAEFNRLGKAKASRGARHAQMIIASEQMIELYNKQLEFQEG